jgi:hypothetical protein
MPKKPVCEVRIPMPFCTQCGTPLDPDKKFCTSCGVQNQTPRVQTPAGSEGHERVLGVITGLEHQRSFLKTDLVNIVVTSEQLLCVPVNKLVQAGVEQAGADALAQNKGFFERYKAKMNVVWASNFSQHFLRMTPGAIVQETPETIRILLNAVITFTIKRSVIVSGEDNEWTNESWNIHIRTSTGLHTFLSRSDPTDQITGNPSINAVIGNHLVQV